MPAISYSEAIRANARAEPDRPALSDETGTLSRAELDRLVDRIGRRLLAEGIEPGSTVAISGRNSARLLAFVFGVFRVGAVPLPIHGRKSREDIEALLGLARPALAVGFDEEIRCEAPKPSVASFCASGEGDAAPLSTDVLSPHMRIGVSGGSTGRSKLIVVDAPALLNPARPWNYGMQKDGVHVVPLELVDGTGFVSATAGLATGCHLVVMSEFEPEELLRLIQLHRADWLAVTPPLMLQVWKLGEARRSRYDLSSLRYVTHYSGATAPWLKRGWLDWLGPERLVESYGATDARGSTWIDGVEWLERPGSVGLPARGCEITILDEQKKAVAPNTPGDIYIRDLTGRRNFHYVGAEVETLPGGWETVGDFGWLDEDGYLYIGDRRKDLIHGREGLVIPFQIESVIEQHDAVRSAVVIGLPSDRPAEEGGKEAFERIHALVDAPYAPVDPSELRAFVAERLPRERVPETFELSDAPLRDHAGKALRAQLRRARMGSEA